MLVKTGMSILNPESALSTISKRTFIEIKCCQKPPVNASAAFPRSMLSGDWNMTVDYQPSAKYDDPDYSR